MLKVMIAEDDFLIAEMIQQILEGAGYDVCGIASTVAEGVALGERYQPDLAVLDLRLAEGGVGTEIAARLARRDTLGILYATANAADTALSADDGDARLTKPYSADEMIRSLKIVEEMVSTGVATPPFPRGFHLLGNGKAGRAQRAHTTGGSKDYKALSEEKDAQIEKLFRQQAAVAGFGSFAFRETDIAKVLMEAARVCAESLGTSFCKVCRYRHEENDLLVEAGVGWNAGVVGNVVSRADETSPQGRAFITGQPSINLDLRKKSELVLPAFYAEHGIISTVDVIIKGNGQPYGVLEVDSTEQRNYDQHDIDFLTGFANVLAEAVGTFKRAFVLVATVEKMKHLVAEKDALAEELQHRVRNNLQLVYGMLVKQLDDTKGGGGTEGLRAIARRVMILAKVYDHLLGTGMSRRVDFAEYLKSLCSSVADFQGSVLGHVTIACNAEPLTLDLDLVTVLGIIATELISNSYRHAFPKGDGHIVVQLKRSADATAILSISDDGQGFTVEEDKTRHGLTLVTRLIAHVKGSAEVHSADGTSWSLTFPCDSEHSEPQQTAA